MFFSPKCESYLFFFWGKGCEIIRHLGRGNFFWILFIFYAAVSYYLSILYILVYTCQSQSPNLSTPTSLLGVHRFVLYICVSISACKLVHLYHFCRFHIYALIYNICFSLSDLLHSVGQSLGPSTCLQMTQFHSFLWLSNIPLYKCTTSSLSIHLLMVI